MGMSLSKRSSRPTRIRQAVMLLAWLLCRDAAFAETVAAPTTVAGWDRPLHGVSADFPDQWSATFEPADPGGVAEVQMATCRTQACARTLETCRIVVPDSVLPTDSFGTSAWLMPVTIGYGSLMKEVLDSSGEGAAITRKPTPLRWGGRFWYVTESLGGEGYKSVMVAIAEVDGRYVRVTCRTCDRSEGRFGFARDILETVAVRP